MMTRTPPVALATSDASVTDEAKRERERQLKAARQGRWRKRRKRGRFVVPVEVEGNLLDRLVARRLLTDAEVYEADLLSQRLAALLDYLSRSR